MSELAQEQNGKKINREGAYCFLVGAMLFCTLIAVLFLVFYGVRFSYYSQRDYSQIEWVEDTLWLHLALFFLVIGGTWIVSRLIDKPARKVQERIGLGVLLTACAWLLIVWSFYIRENPYYPVGDQLNTTAGAYYNLQGNFSMLSPGGYIGMYQQQKGLMFLYEILFTLFGDFNYGAAAQIHVLLGIVALIAGYLFLKLHTERILPGMIFCVLWMFCMPFMLYMPYIYGDIPEICLCMVLFCALSAYGKSGKRQYVLIAALAAGIALLERMNTWIILIAAAVGLFLYAFRKWSWKPLLAALLVLLVAEGSVKAVDVMYEYRSGFESGVGIPSILWIAMGLQETNGLPGVYNRYQQSVFAEHNFEREPAAAEGMEYIRERLQEFSRDPEMARDFFRRKLQTQWLEPLFESLYSTESFDEERKMPEWIWDLYYGEFHDTVWKLANYYQSIVYLGAALFVAASLLGKGKSRMNGIFWIPLIAVEGGFLFSIIWENQCRYVLPYFMFMLLYVPLGLEKGADGLAWAAGKVSSLWKERGGL